MSSNGKKWVKPSPVSKLCVWKSWPRRRLRGSFPRASARSRASKLRKRFSNKELTYRPVRTFKKTKRGISSKPREGCTLIKCCHIISGLLGPYFPRRHTKVIVSSKSVPRPAVPELNMFLHPSFLDSPKVTISKYYLFCVQWNCIGTTLISL